MPQPTVPGFIQQRIDDARDASHYVKSLWGILQLSRRRRELETELGVGRRRIGEAAEKARVGDELAAMQGVRDTRAALTAAQAELQQHKEELVKAEETRRQQETHHNQIVAPIEADCGRLSQDASAAFSAKTSAEKQIGQIEREIKRIEAALSAVGPEKPSPQTQPQLLKQLADLRQNLEPARGSLVKAAEAHQQAAGVAQKNQAEMNSAKEARKQALAGCDEEIERCRVKIKETETTIGKCEVSLAAAHGELGKAVLDANLTGSGLEELIDQARSLMGKMATVGEQSSQTREMANANRGAAIRTVAALAVIVLAIGLVWIMAAKLMRPGQTSRSETAMQPAPALSEAPATLEKAILALPELKTPNVKVTGKLTVNQTTPRGESAKIIDLSLPVEITVSGQGKPLTGIALIRVLADSQDRILNSEITLPDPDLAELEALGRN